MPSTLTQYLVVLYFLILLSFTFSDEKATSPVDSITIRESTIDYQLRVGSRLFVFGKESAGLEKIKVGMRMLDFHQQAANGTSSDSQKLKWTRLKDGSVVLEKWADGLLLSQWTVFPSGQIQYENRTSTDQPFDLGFQIIEENLAGYQWQGINRDFSEKGLLPMDKSSKKALQIGSFHRLSLEFEDLNVHITPLDQPVFAEILPNEDATRFKAINFKTHPSMDYASDSPGQSSEINPPVDRLPIQSLKLNFEFYQ